MPSRNRPEEARGQDRLGNMASTRFYLFFSDGKDVGLRFKAWKQDFEFVALKRLGGRALNLRLGGYKAWR